MLRSLIFIPVVTIGFAVPAMAQQKLDLPEEGKYEITGCTSRSANSVDFSKTHSAGSTATPISTRIVSNGEYLPPPQSETQKRVERRVFESTDENGKRLGVAAGSSCGRAAAWPRPS
jgi:hypothetical protein